MCCYLLSYISPLTSLKKSVCPLLCVPSLHSGVSIHSFTVTLWSEWKTTLLSATLVCSCQMANVLYWILNPASSFQSDLVSIYVDLHLKYKHLPQTQMNHEGMHNAERQISTTRKPRQKRHKKTSKGQRRSTVT